MRRVSSSRLSQAPGSGLGVGSSAVARLARRPFALACVLVLAPARRPRADPLRHRAERRAGVRRLGTQRRRHVHHGLRLHEPELRGGARYSGRGRQHASSPASRRSGPADALLPAPPAVRVQGPRAEGLGQEGSRLDAERRTARPRRPTRRCCRSGNSARSSTRRIAAARPRSPTRRNRTQAPTISLRRCRPPSVPAAARCRSSPA